MILTCRKCVTKMVIKDIKRISRNSLWFTVGVLLTQAINFFLLPVYTRFLTPADYGIISLAAVLYSIISIFSFFGLRSAIARFFYEYKQDEEEFKEYISTMWISITSIALFIAIFLTIAGGIIFPILLPNLPFYPYIVLVIWTVFFAIPFIIYLALLQMQEQSKLYGFFCVFQFIINSAFIIIFIVIFHEGALGSLKGQLMSSLVFFLIGLWCLKPDICLCFRKDKIKESLKFALPLLPHELAGWTTSQLNRIFLSNFTTLSIVGLYSLGYQFGSMLSIVTTAINFAWVPFFMSTAKEQGDEAKPRFAGLTIYYQCFIFFVGLGIILFSPNIIRIMTIPSYYPAMEVVPIIVLMFLFDGMYYIWANNLVFVKKTGFLSFSTITGAVINVILSLILIHQFGMYGAAFTMLCTYGFTCGFVFYFSNKEYPISYDYKKMGKITIIFIIAFIPTLIIPYYGFLIDIGIKLILLGIYLSGLIISGVISIDELILGKKYAQETIRDIRMVFKS